jgi:hypothetical protein
MHLFRRNRRNQEASIGSAIRGVRERREQRGRRNVHENRTTRAHRENQDSQILFGVLTRIDAKIAEYTQKVENWNARSVPQQEEVNKLLIKITNTARHFDEIEIEMTLLTESDRNAILQRRNPFDDRLHAVIQNLEIQCSALGLNFGGAVDHLYDECERDALQIPSIVTSSINDASMPQNSTLHSHTTSRSSITLLNLDAQSPSTELTAEALGRLNLYQTHPPVQGQPRYSNSYSSSTSSGVTRI